MSHCQTFKQKIEKLKGKAQSIEGLLLEYRNTGKEEIAQQLERELEGVLQEIEKFKEGFKNEATQLIEEFIQRRDNKNEELEIIFDEEDYRFVITGDLFFDKRTTLDDFPNLIKELRGYLSATEVQTLDLPKLKKARYILAFNAQTINLPNLEEAEDIYGNTAQTLDLPKLKKAWNIHASNAQTINLPNLEEAQNIRAYQAQTITLPNIRKLIDIYFYENNPNLESLSNQAREWRTRGILKGKIKLVDKNGYLVKEL
jgi:hypothetical protein